ncbi:hypothetical protein HN011_011459 [Eciton burchellii]|nr:hypothetical protein HN011_011459 [Eciton burchellii]
MDQIEVQAQNDSGCTAITILFFNGRLLQLLRPLQEKMGSVVLYHEFFMMGRAHKTLIHPDLKLPLILGYGKRTFRVA